MRMTNEHSNHPISGNTDYASVVAELDAAATRLTTPCGDGEMVWRRWGDGPALVCLHGSFGSWTHWIRNIPVFAERFSVYVPDLPGLGDSAMPPEPYSFQGLGRIVADGIDRLLPSAQHYDITGFSFGASLAGHAAHFHGDRVRTCILVSSGGMGLTRNEPQGLKNWRRAETDEERAAANRHNLSVMMFGDAGKIDDFAVYLQSENTSRARFRNRILSHRFDNLVTALPHVQAALKGLWGEYDVYAKNRLDERRDYLRSIQPDADVRVIPEAGHWLMYEAPDISNDAFLDMLGHGA